MKILTALFAFIVALLVMGVALYYAVWLVIKTYEATNGNLFLVLFEIVVFCICAFGVTIK